MTTMSITMYTGRSAMSVGDIEEKVFCAPSALRPERVIIGRPGYGIILYLSVQCAPLYAKLLDMMPAERAGLYHDIGLLRLRMLLCTCLHL